MLEFDSINVSSYEADTLAPKLTEKSAAGWEVVSIVSTGTSVTAYLSRAAGSATSAHGADYGAGAAAPVSASSPDSTEVAVEGFGGEEVGPLGDADVAPAEASGDSPWASSAGVADSPEAPSVATPSTPEPAPVDNTPSVPEPMLPGATDARSVPDAPGPADAPPVSGPQGSDAAGASLADDVAALASQISDERSEPTSESGGWAATTDTASGTVTDAASQPAAQAEPATHQQASAATAPAGWYADPSGRFELRYWDGNQWTEHVSRAGQQYTDPPVA